jgi:hypothetical protein
MSARESIAAHQGGLTVEDLFAESGGVVSFRAEVVEVMPGKAFNGSGAEEVPFDADSADWRSGAGAGGFRW